MGQSRYIKMTGDPVAVKEPLRQTFYRANDFSVFLGAAGLDFILNPGQATGPGGFTDLANVVGCGVVNLALWRGFERFHLMPDSLEGKCIDTKPDEHTPPTTAQYGQHALFLRAVYRRLFLLGCAFDLGLAFTQASERGHVGVALLNRAMMNGVYYARMVDGYRRFNRVLKGTWQIVDMPTPEKLAETEKSEHEKAVSVAQPIPV